MKKDFIENEISERTKINFSYNDIANKVNIKDELSNLNNNSSFRKNKRSMYKKFTISILSILIVGVVTLIVYNLNKLTYDYEKGAIASKIIDNAQYLPDIDKFLEVNNHIESLTPVNKTLSTKTSSSDMTNVEFAELLDECSVFYNNTGSGKYLGYDIYEIKEEIQYVVDNVPAFNQWFRMPIMREEEGYIKVPYYENWAYYLEYNESTSYLSITRVCWCTRSSYFDFENKVTIEDYDDGTSFVQYEVMKINYFHNEDNKEVVECYGYNVGIDRVKNGGTCNENINDYYPFEYQYLKNVKDESLIKYNIIVAKRYLSDEGFDQGGMDIRGLYPYGYLRDFIIINYDTYKNIDFTRIKQSENNNTNLDFSLEDNNIKLLSESLGMVDSEYNKIQSNNEFLDAICKLIIDNFELKNNWPIIYKESTNAYKIDKIYGKFYQKKVPIFDLSNNACCTAHNLNEIEYWASTDITDVNQFDLDKMYSLSMALRKDDGTIYILGTDYQKLEKVYYAGSTETYYYRLNSNIELLVNDNSNPLFTIEEPGTYVLTTVLTCLNQGEDEIIFDTLSDVYLTRFIGLNIPSYESFDGTIYSYSVKGKGKKLEITVTSNKETKPLKG